MATALMEPGFDMDRLNYEIFSILESKFLFGYDDAKPAGPGSTPPTPPRHPSGKIRILSIDGGGGPTDGLLAAAALSRLESLLQMQTGDPHSRIADFFDVVAGSGAGGVLAAMLFTKSADGRPLFAAEEAVEYLARHRGKLAAAPKKGLFRGLFRKTTGGKRLRRVFADSTLKDTLKPVLIPCYDLATGGAFLFSRADAVETDGYDFRMREVCAATCADTSAVEMRSVDGRTRILAVGGGLAMGNPTAAAITHVLNNKQEFPFANGVEDLLVVSLGGGEAEHVSRGAAPPSAGELVRIAGEGVADMVDQAVAMAFGQGRTNNYVRIQSNGFGFGSRSPTSRSASATPDVRKVMGAAEEVLAQRNVESLLFRGKKISEHSNMEKLDRFSGELVKEHERRKKSPIPTVIIKQAMTPRTSSSTTSTITTTTTSSSRTSTSP